MTAQIENTFGLIELLFDTGYLDIADEPDQETLTEAFILFCIDNGCYDAGCDNAEQKALEVYDKLYRREDNNSGESDGKLEEEMEETALRICIRKLNTCKS